jgi:hypothetical protein
MQKRKWMQEEQATPDYLIDSQLVGWSGRLTNQADKPQIESRSDRDD